MRGGGNAQDRRRQRRAAERRVGRRQILDDLVAAAVASIEDESAADIRALAKFAVQGGTFDLGDRDEAWDGPAAEKSYTLPRDANHYMWKDPDGDPSAKSSYKFPFVSDGHAVWKAITAISAILQGGRGGTNIPDADKAKLRTKIEGYYSAARKKYEDDTIKVPWADGESAAESEELAGSPMSGKCADCGHMALSHGGEMNDGACAMNGCGCDGFVPAGEAALTPEALALERLDAALPRLFANGDVAWGPEEGFVDLLCDVNEALGGDGDDDTPGPRAVDVSVKLDKVLICDTDGDYYVAPIMIGSDGEPKLGDRDFWRPIESPDDDEDGQTAAARVRFTLSEFQFAPEVALPDAHKPGQRIPKRNPSPRTPVPPAGAQTGGPAAWEALFLPEATLTDDGRAFAPGSITWRELPLTLMAMTTTSAQGGHDGAEAAGRIDRIWRDGNLIKAAGVFDDGEYGAEIARMVADGTLRGLSVDTAIHEYEVGPRSDYFTDDGDWIEQKPEGEKEQPSLVDLLFGDESDEQIFVVTSAVIGMATVCPFPAFAEANISLAASGAVWRYTGQAGFIVVQQKPSAVVAGAAAGQIPTGTDVRLNLGLAVTAGALDLAPLTPPAEWFEDPGLEALTPLTVTDDGRIYGHAWSWETCHLSFPDSCVLAPRTGTENSYFHLGEIECEGGERIPVGKITLDTGHAGPRASRAAATAHYDDTGTVAAHVRCGEDEFGGWVSGAVSPDLSDEKLRVLRGAVLSGDWRAVRMADGRSNLELVALLAVNVPGFPVPRQPRGLVAAVDGEATPLALTAAGIVTPETVATQEQALSEIASLARQAQGDCGCSEAV